ncbi:hypothetical protein COW46_01950 [Candidatus Gracilibacteria bacterium CG17_big_fil_post_rev_8_21_14_2_50_48_13]|nr:MAG: hypothetical protein COW46_01950 [Candidatus Gracilibacteria bacterium CG17_big_fil_post_rev_8_21_14_2_50_48_13]
MLYAHLLHIMRHIKKFVQCPGCQQHFTNRDIDLVELHDDGMLMYVDCPRCHTEIEMEIGIQDGNLVPIINVSREPVITKEDVENVAAQLDKHKGALKSLFTKAKERKKKK